MGHQHALRKVMGMGGLQRPWPSTDRCPAELLCYVHYAFPPPPKSPCLLPVSHSVFLRCREVLEGGEDMVTLWNIYAGKPPPDPAPAGANKANSVGRIISQAFMYMSTHGHVYGCITTYKRTWLLRCIQDNILCVSRCFKYDDTHPSTAEVRSGA